MKKIFFGFWAVILNISMASAEDFFGDLMVTEDMKEDIKNTETRLDGQSMAGKLLDSKPVILKMDKNMNIRVREHSKEQVVPVVREPAPFGLKWLASIQEVRNLKVSLERYEVKDVPQTYLATNLPKPVSSFLEVLISFGENDALWRIAAYGKFMTDDSKASKGVEEYRKYYDMLAKKYGNAQQFYTPAKVNVEEKVPGEDGTSTIVVRQEKMEIGAEGFLKKLQSGEAFLYATFENGKIGVTLALMVDGRGQSYIVVDYKNLTAKKQENEEIYEAL